MKSFVALLFVVTFGAAYAQQGSITINKDSRIDGLVGREGAIPAGEINPKMDGYRIQLFFDSDREAINEARNKFISKYPRIDTYTTYNAPNFFLRVGDFRTRMEAEKVKEELNSLFPTSFIVTEEINLPRLERERKDP